MPEKARCLERRATLLDPFERFLKRMHDKPEQAAHLPQKIVPDPADPLGDCYWLARICHVHGEIALLRRMEKSKVSLSV